MTKFKRAGRSKSSTDLKGTVLVKCILVDRNGAVKGNQVTTLRVADAKVSEVHAAIEKYLFGNG